MGTKRGRLLIRQPRVKRDSDTMNQSPETDYDHLAFSHRLLSVPHQKIERHASEPSPNYIQQFSSSSTSSSSHLLSVPQTPYLVKQHSHPLLLPSQSTETHYTLHRQLSYPISSDNSQLITMTSSPPIITSTCVPASTLPPEVLTPASTIAVSHFATDRIIKDEPQHQLNEPITKSRAASPTIVTVAVVTPTPTSDNALPTIRIKGEELQRSISSPQVSVLRLCVVEALLKLNQNYFPADQRAIARESIAALSSHSAWTGIGLQFLLEYN